MKRTLKWLLSIGCMAIACAGFAACNGNTTGGGNTPTYTLNIVNESVTLELLQEYELQYAYDGEETLVWTVENPDVVTVENGKLVALAAGETAVSVQAGKLFDTCVVKVNSVNVDLLKISTESTQISLYAEETYTLKPTLTYNGTILDVADFVYDVDTQSVVEISETGVLTAKDVGEASVSIMATAFEKTVGCIVQVSVQQSGAIALDVNQEQIYALSEFEGQTFKNEVELTATVHEKGVVKTDAEVVWTSSNSAVATVENGKVTAVSVGQTEITATYVGMDGKTATAVSTIFVRPVEYIATEKTDIIKTQLFDVTDIDEAAGISVSAAYITDGVLELSVPLEEGEMDFSAIGLVGEATLMMHSENVLLNLPIYLWTSTISAVSDLENLRTTPNGHYRLSNDLDMQGEAWEYAEPTVFKGVFDGEGFAIKNFVATANGLFSKLGNGAKVQNVKFEYTTVQGTAIGALASSVEAGANVHIEGIEGDVILNADSCGGLFGAIAKNANVTLTSCDLHVFAINATADKGAIVGCADSAIVLAKENPSQIYTSIALCGNKKQEDYDNSAAAAINQMEKVTPAMLDAQKINLYDVLVGSKTITLSLENVAKTTLFAQTNSEVEFTETNFTIPASAIEGFVGSAIELKIEKVNGERVYYAIPVEYGKLLLTNENKQILRYAYGGTILLQEDIDLGGETWTTQARFNGTINGNGYAIKNLVTADNDSNNYGLFKYIAGEVKNIAFVNVTLGKNSGVLAGRTSASLTVTNVLIQVSKTTGGRSGAIVERSREDNAIVNLKDTIIVMPKNSGKEYIYGYQLRARSLLDNVYCIGLPEGAYSETGADYILPDSTVQFHTDKIAFSLELSKAESQININETVKAFVDKYVAIRVLEVRQSNVTDLLTLRGDEYVMLKEDVDLSGIEWNGNVTFTGTFDGENHAIKNLTTVASNGFFKVLAGTVKNVAFTNVTLVAGTAVLASRGGESTSTIENVFIQVTKTNSSGSNRFGVICERQNNAVAMNLTNVLIVMPGTAANEAIYGYTLRGQSSLKDVYCIGLPNEDASIQNEGKYFKGTYTLYENLTAFITAEATLPTEFLQEYADNCFDVYKIKQSNATDLLTLQGDEYVIIMEDIDLAGIEWNGNVTFTGTLDGANHAIKNLTTVANNGFFKVLAGTVKNVAFTNVTLTAGTAVLAFRGGEATSKIENVFIQVTKTNSSGSNRFGVICERQNNAVAMNLTNVLIVMPGTAANEAIYGYTLKGKSTLTNVHCIGLPDEAASVHNTTGTSYFSGDYKFHTDLNAFNSAEKTLTEFLTSCVATYLQNS